MQDLKDETDLEYKLSFFFLKIQCEQNTIGEGKRMLLNKEKTSNTTAK